jgi:DNA-binding response OmpR family regulator
MFNPDLKTVPDPRVPLYVDGARGIVMLGESGVMAPEGGHVQISVAGLLRHLNDTELAPDSFLRIPLPSTDEMKTPDPMEPFTFCGGQIQVDPQEARVYFRENPVDMTLKEYELTTYLGRMAGMVRTRQQILDNAWTGQTHIGERTIDVHVRRVRAKTTPEAIITRRSIGYYASK